MTSVRVRFITNRNHEPTNKLMVFGPRFNPDGVAALRFGYADFTLGEGGPKLTDVFVYPDAKDHGDINRTGGGLFLDDLKAVMAEAAATPWCSSTASTSPSTARSRRVRAWPPRSRSPAAR
jgi:hypothetical protein